jgi:uncharacterized protein (DUF1330 family)
LPVDREVRITITYKAALTLLGGIALGGAAVQVLHAQAKPTAYVVVAVRSIKDPEAFKTGVVDKASPAKLAEAGGRYVIRTQAITSLDGPAPQRFVLLAFDSVDKARAWSNSPSSQESTAARIKSTDSLSLLVEGVTE